MTMLVVPIISREPLPGDLQADLNEVTHILRVAPHVHGHAFTTILLEAVLTLNGRLDLTAYASRPSLRPRFEVIEGGYDRGAV